MNRRHALAGALALLLALAAGGAAVGAARSGAAAPEPRKRALDLPASAPGPQALPEAAATIQRTFVSTSGSDGNPCTSTAPCRSFAVAIANTTAGGEVVAVDSGGYGPFTVDKAITIAGAPGEHVAISVFSGTGIDVNAGPEDTVVLRNLYVTGLGGQTGIFFQAGAALHVESVVVAGTALFGLNATADGGRLLVRDSTFRKNGSIGIAVLGNLRAEISDTRADRNAVWGIHLRFGARGTIVRSEASLNGAAGFVFWGAAVATVRDSVADSNGQYGLTVEELGTTVTVDSSVLTNNALAGVRTIFPGAVGRIAGCTVTGNGTGLAVESGTLESFGDNVVRGNTTNLTGVLTSVGKT